MTIPHTHRYRFPDVTLLTLPDMQGWSDCFLQWRCMECGVARPYTTCQVHEETRNMTYEACMELWETERKARVQVR